MAAKGPRENITLECTECKQRNYMTSKNKRNNRKGAYTYSGGPGRCTSSAEY